MNLTSFLANKCFEFLLKTNSDGAGRKDDGGAHSGSKISSSLQSCFSPPWVQDSQLLRMNCDGCGNCLSSCEKSILVCDKDGYPQVDFSIGSCSFCGACVESCPRDVFERVESIPPWSLKARITSGCLSHHNVLCRTCSEYCEYKAIVFSQSSSTISTPMIVTDKCNGCGACFGPCPVGAISIINTVEYEKS